MPGYLQQFAAFSPRAQEEEIEAKLQERFSDIAEEQAFVDCAAESNADNWAVESYDVLDYEVTETGIRINLAYDGLGDHSDSDVNGANQIEGTAIAIIDDDGELWFEDVTARLVFGDEEDETTLEDVGQERELDAGN